MKTRFAAFAAFASAAFAADPGSYAPVTLSITVTVPNAETSRPLQSGNTEHTYSVRKYTIGNTAILAEATRRGILSTSDYRGWKIVAAFTRDTDFVGFFAYNKTLDQSAYLGPIIAPDAEDGARADAGKVQRTPADAIAAGNLTFTEAGPMYVLIDGEFFEGMLFRTSGEKLKPVPAGGFQWVPNAGSGPFIGYTAAGAVFKGTFAHGPGVQVADLAPRFVVPEPE